MFVCLNIVLHDELKLKTFLMLYEKHQYHARPNYFQQNANVNDWQTDIDKISEIICVMC